MENVPTTFTRGAGGRGGGAGEGGSFCYFLSAFLDTRIPSENDLLLQEIICSQTKREMKTILIELSTLKVYHFPLSLSCQISDDICRLFFYLNKLSFRKTFICKAERLNVKQQRSR